MKQQLYILVVVLITTLNGYAQKTLKKLLWNSVESCYSQLDNVDNIEIIEDVKNGYLKVSAFCETSVAAFKTKEGNFTTLVQYKDLYNFTYKIKSNKKLQDIIPKKINLLTFIPDGNISLFYFDIVPPKKGTDIIVIVKPTPFGIKNVKKSPFIYSTREGIENFVFFRDIVPKIKDSKTLKFILNKNYNAITKEDFNLISNNIGKGSVNYKDWTWGVVSSKLKKLYTIYQNFESRSYDAILLGWNKSIGKFYVKEKRKKKKAISFKQFLNNNSYWAAIG